jgi:hypothetical protein
MLHKSEDTPCLPGSVSEKCIRLQKIAISWQCNVLMEKNEISAVNFNYFCALILPVQLIPLPNMNTIIIFLEEWLKHHLPTLSSASGQALWRSQADIIGQQTS